MSAEKKFSVCTLIKIDLNETFVLKEVSKLQQSIVWIESLALNWIVHVKGVEKMSMGESKPDGEE